MNRLAACLMVLSLVLSLVTPAIAQQPAEDSAAARLLRMKKRLDRDGLKPVLREYDAEQWQKIQKLLEDLVRELESRERQE